MPAAAVIPALHAMLSIAAVVDLSPPCVSAPKKTESLNRALRLEERRGDLNSALCVCGEDGAGMEHGGNGGDGGCVDALGTGGMGILGGRTEAKARGHGMRVGQG